MNIERQKNKKIFNQIDKLSAKGKNYVLDYYRLIDEIIAKGDYGYFDSTLNEYFKIDINHYQTIQDVKEKTWDKIVLQSNVPFSKRLKKLYDNKGVYQIGYYIYNNYNILLGFIKEHEIYNIESKYYIKNKQLSKLQNQIITNLEVNKINSETIYIDVFDNSINNERNLLNKYEIAINYLLSNVNDYIEDYVDDYVE